MACIKGVNRSALVALAPDAPYLAAGTMAGAVDLSFSSSANLEIFKIDFQSDDPELPLVAEYPSSDRFNRLSWGRNGSSSEEFALGLVAGGLVDGNIDLWNPLSLIRSEENESSLVGHLVRHKGPVRGLEFNSIAPNLLASGAEDGEICIWDLANPLEPTHFPPLKGSGSASQGEVSFLSWNSKVQHILASTSYNGTTVVWDLKKQKSVISVVDPVRRRGSALQWHPDVATQLAVASDEDGSPSIKLWDMRNTMTPVKEFVGHSRGVIAMSWCPNDSSYLLTCGKDSRTICWDTISGEIAYELPAGTNWNFDVHWYSKIPGVISASSFDVKIGIYNIKGCRQSGESDFGAVPLRAPKWYKRPVGASFGFGGKLVSFHPGSSASDSPAGASEVYVHNMVTEDGLVSRSSEFEAAIQNGERTLLRVLCDKKSQESVSEEERETWGFLKVMFEEDGTARTKLLTHLGFNVPSEEKDIVNDELSQEINALGLEGTSANNIGHVATNEANNFFLDNGEDFFNNIPSPKADTPPSAAAGNFVAADNANIGAFIRNMKTKLQNKIIIMLTVGSTPTPSEEIISLVDDKIVDLLNIETYHFSLYASPNQFNTVGNDVTTNPNSPYGRFKQAYDIWSLRISKENKEKIIMGIDFGNTFQVVTNKTIMDSQTVEYKYVPYDIPQEIRGQLIQIKNLCNIQANAALYSWPWKNLSAYALDYSQTNGSYGSCNTKNNWTRKFDQTNSVPWLYNNNPYNSNVDFSIFYVSYEDFSSLYAKLLAVGGVSISDISYDDDKNSLLNYIRGNQLPSSPVDLPPTKNNPDNHKANAGVIVGAVLGGLLLLVVSCFVWYRRKYILNSKDAGAISKSTMRSHTATKNAEMSCDSSPNRFAVPTTVIPVACGYVTAMFDFEGKEENDLSFRKGDKIEVLERGDGPNDWWVGRVNNTVGEFPGNYVKETG